MLPLCPALWVHVSMHAAVCSSCRRGWGWPRIAPVSEVMDVLSASKRRGPERGTLGRDSAGAIYWEGKLVPSCLLHLVTDGWRAEEGRVVLGQGGKGEPESKAGRGGTICPQELLV